MAILWQADWGSLLYAKSPLFYDTYIKVQHYQQAVLGHYWPTSETPFKWRFAGGPMVARF